MRGLRAANLALTFFSGDKRDLFFWIVGSSEVLSGSFWQLYTCRTTGGEIMDPSDSIVCRSR